MAVRTKLFRVGRSQAVRLPKEVAFSRDVTDVLILREGSRRVIVLANRAWDDFFDEPGADWPARDQPTPQERDWP